MTTDQTPQMLEATLGEPERRGQFDHDQVASMLLGIASVRVMDDGKGHAHVSQQDVTAHLIRTFGFGGFDTRIVSLDLVFEQPTPPKNGQERPGRWDACYRAMMELTVRNRRGETVAVYENVSTGTAQNQTRGDAHDLASKSAVSLAMKRCAINLGDQFGLSLYNKGQMMPLVRRTLVMPPAPEATEEPAADLQEGVAQQVAMGADESDTATPSAEDQARQQQAGAAPLDADPLPENWLEVGQAAEAEGDLDLITELLKSAVAVDPQGEAAHKLRGAWTRVKRNPKAAK